MRKREPIGNEIVVRKPKIECLPHLIGERRNFALFGNQSSQNACTMGLMDPSEDDQQREKKPRFIQDFAVVIIFLAAALIYVILEWLVF
jgi:hypothetical protein